MVLVDSDFRHRGIGTRLVQHALQYLDGQGVSAVRLDATALGRPVYERLGFVAQFELMRMEGVMGGGVDAAVTPSSAEPSCPGTACAIRPAGPDDSRVLAAWDQEATGTPRGRLLECLLADPGSRAYWTGDGQPPGGYVISRCGSRAAQLGPAVAFTAAAGSMLLDRAATDWTGQRVYLDVPVDNRAAVVWAESHGLVCQRSFTRMVRGRPVSEDIERLWASSGPEKG
jgi:predicted GNAT family acetyltransferase